MSSSLLSVWRKGDSKRHRRAIALKQYHGNKTVAAQALLEIHNQSRDREVRQKARADAVYFLNLSKHNGKKR